MLKTDDFLVAIREAGMSPPKTLAPGRWARFAGVGKSNGNTAGFAYLFPDGEGGLFGDFASGIKEAWQSERVRQMPEGDRIAWRRLVEEAQAEAERKQAEAWAEAAIKAQGIVSTLPESSEGHKYLIRKHVKAYGLKEKNNALVMPLCDSSGQITTYQTITETGEKKLMYGGRMKGCAFAIKGKASPVYVCEGYATGATVHEATGCSVLVAVCASNIGPVVDSVLLRHNDTQVIIAADNDHSGQVNTGVVEAEKVKDRHPHVYVMIPPAIPEANGADWNDYAVKHGIDAARRLLSPRRSRSISTKDLMAATYSPLKWAVKGIIPEGLTVLAGKPKFGKSWLMTGLSYDIATGGKVWGFVAAERAAPVHYFALEDSERRMQDRIHQMEGYIVEYPDNMHIYTSMPRIGEGFLDELDAVIDRYPDTGLIIIDTLAKVRPVGNVKSNANMYSSEYEDLGQLQQWAIGRGVPVVVIHHTRKGGQGTKAGNPFDELSGSSGIQGVADTIIVCQRPAKSNEGTMLVTGREVSETEYKMIFRKNTMSWEVSVGDDEPVVDTAEMVLQIWFKDHDHITIKDAAHLWDLNQRTAHRRLDEMVAAGELFREKTPPYNTLLFRERNYSAAAWIDKY